MFDTHERILQRLHDSGHKEFSVEVIRGIIDIVEAEEIDRMYDEWRRETDPHTNRDYEPVSWENTTENLGASRSWQTTATWKWRCRKHPC